jgi:hypothetical protein
MGHECRWVVRPADRGRMSLLERKHVLEDGNVEPNVHGEEPGQASQAGRKSGGRDLRCVRGAWRDEQALVHRDFARAVALMEAVARTEKDIADTLRAMARLGGSEAAARRLRLAEAAIKGAQQAAGHAERLQRMADRWARHAELAALQQSLGHAGRVLADLASAEEDIAGILTKLASKDGSDLAEERRHLADEALAGAQRARDRARALRRLAQSAAGAPAPAGGPAAEGGTGHDSSARLAAGR